MGLMQNQLKSFHRDFCRSKRLLLMKVSKGTFITGLAKGDTLRGRNLVEEHMLIAKKSKRG